MISKPIVVARNQGSLDTYMSASQVYGGASSGQSRSPSAPSKQPTATQSTLTAFAVPVQVPRAPPVSHAPSVAPVTAPVPSSAPARHDAAVLVQPRGAGDAMVTSDVFPREAMNTKPQQAPVSTNPAIAYGARYALGAIAGAGMCIESSSHPSQKPLAVAPTRTTSYGTAYSSSSHVAPTDPSTVATSLPPSLPGQGSQAPPSHPIHQSMSAAGNRGASTNTSSHPSGLSAANTSQAAPSSATIPPEVLSRIEANRLQALERRKRALEAAVGAGGSDTSSTSALLPSKQAAVQLAGRSAYPPAPPVGPHVSSGHGSSAAGSVTGPQAARGGGGGQQFFRTGGGAPVSVTEDALRRADGVLGQGSSDHQHPSTMTADTARAREQQQPAIPIPSHIYRTHTYGHHSGAASTTRPPIPPHQQPAAGDHVKRIGHYQPDNGNEKEDAEAAHRAQEHIALMAARSTSAVPANFSKFSKGNRKSERSID
jgi:hypothetical protein